MPSQSISVDFRAPPPSPVASGRRSSVTNDDVLTEFLDGSLRVPDLVLPDKIFPRHKHLETPPKVDFVSLCLHHDDALRDAVSDSMARIGCFQLVNHGIPKELIASAAEAAVGIFRLPREKRAVATRSAGKPWGFEEYHAGEEEEEQGSELSEEFVWCNDGEFKLKMEGICPIGYPNFSNKMESLVSRIEMVGKKMMPVILKNVPRKTAYFDGEMADDRGTLTLCCVYKHRGDNWSEDGWANSLKFDVIRTLIRGTDYCHSLCLHVCDGSSEFHVYSKKSWLSFFPHEGALIITAGDHIQTLSGGHYKHVIGRPIFKGEKEDRISMAFLYSTPNKKNNFQTNMGRTISLGQQAILAILMTIVYHVIIYIHKMF